MSKRLPPPNPPPRKLFRLSDQEWTAIGGILNLGAVGGDRAVRMEARLKRAREQEQEQTKKKANVDSPMRTRAPVAGQVSPMLMDVEPAEPLSAADKEINRQLKRVATMDKFVHQFKAIPHFAKANEAHMRLLRQERISVQVRLYTYKEINGQRTTDSTRRGGGVHLNHRKDEHGHVLIMMGTELSMDLMRGELMDSVAPQDLGEDKDYSFDSWKLDKLPTFEREKIERIVQGSPPARVTFHDIQRLDQLEGFERAAVANQDSTKRYVFHSQSTAVLDTDSTKLTFVGPHANWDAHQSTMTKMCNPGAMLQLKEEAIPEFYHGACGFDIFLQPHQLSKDHILNFKRDVLAWQSGSKGRKRFPSLSMTYRGLWAIAKKPEVFGQRIPEFDQDSLGLTLLKPWHARPRRTLHK